MKASQKKKVMAIQPPVLNRREVTRKAEKYAALLTGLEDNTTTLSGRIWKFANGAKIAEYIRGYLAEVGNIYGIRDADLTRLNDPLTGPAVVRAAIV